MKFKKEDSETADSGRTKPCCEPHRRKICYYKGCFAAM